MNSQIKVLIGCEYSGRVREAFKKYGFDVWSCDLLPTEIPGQHYQGDIFEALNQPLVIGSVCTCINFRETPMINGKHICSICNKPIVQTDR